MRQNSSSSDRGSRYRPARSSATSASGQDGPHHGAGVSGTVVSANEKSGGTEGACGRGVVDGGSRRCSVAHSRHGVRHRLHEVEGSASEKVSGKWTWDRGRSAGEAGAEESANGTASESVQEVRRARP